ncbi:placenta-specific protein 9 isoform X1 [Fukomys damarensis]|uniref:placenta-specific protein 9 isoform X1 n=1 Tax=Fukomys damarensis TaxID=885580 RepID=UPI0008FED290|nr:placenta-specific protein 9 isoform X1 [Fukomys damarensis]
MCLPAIVKAVLPCAHCTVRPNTAVPCSVRAQDIRRRKSSSDSEGTAAEPLSTSQGDPAWSTGCDRLEAVQGRLDVMEEVAVTWADCPTPALDSALLPTADGGEDGGAPGDPGEKPVGTAGGSGLEPAPGALQPGPRSPRG